MKPKEEEEVRTDIAVEETAAPVKGKKPWWWFIALGAVLLLIAAGAFFRACRKQGSPSHQPTAEELQ